MEELDLAPYYLSIIAAVIASLALLVSVLLYLRHRKENRSMITNGDLLNEVKKLFQDLESKLQTIGATESMLNEVKAIRQNLESKLDELGKSHVASKISEGTATGPDARLDKALSGLEFLTTYFKIRDGIDEYGSRILESYDAFMSRVDDESKALESGHVEGREYVLRSNMLLFALMMRVYLHVFGQPDSLEMIDQYIERAKRLT